MTTDFRKQVEETARRKLQFFHHSCPADVVVDGYDDLKKCTCGIDTAIQDTADAIVKLHEAELDEVVKAAWMTKEGREAEAERVRKDAASENRFAGMSDDGMQQLIANAEYEIVRRAAIEPKTTERGDV